MDSDWIDRIDNAEFLRTLFPKAPLLRGVRVLEVGLHQDGPRVLFRFDLNEFPLQPPAKWKESHANKVQIRMMGVGIHELEVQGWSTNNIVDIEIGAGEARGVRFVAQGAGFRVSSLFERLILDGVSAYTDAAR